MSQTRFRGRFHVVDAVGKAMEEISAPDSVFDFDAVFERRYAGIARVIARVVRDPARAEELAVDVFWKLWRNPSAQGEIAAAWLYRTAVRAGIDELRRQNRRARHEQLLGLFGRAKTPEQIHAAVQQQEHVRGVLGRLRGRQAELLVLRADGLSYEELGEALRVSPASVGTLLGRAQQAFRKEYVKQYGEPRYER